MPETSMIGDAIREGIQSVFPDTTVTVGHANPLFVLQFRDLRKELPKQLDDIAKLRAGEPLPAKLVAVVGYDVVWAQWRIAVYDAAKLQLLPESTDAQ